MDSTILADYADRIEADLRGNVLPFWMRHAVDRERGAFFGAITNELIVDRIAERGALLTSRILWTFSAAYRRYHDTAYLEMADRAHADLTSHFFDRDRGGFFWSIASDGKVLRDRKQIYGQAFAIYALSEYHRAIEPKRPANGRASASPVAPQKSAPLEQAIATFQLTEAHARDGNHGGYFEAFSPDWRPIADMRLSAVDLNEPKSQNTHLHLMEAYTNLLRIWPDATLRRALAELLELMLDRIVQPTGHLGLFFEADWSPRSDGISYGHDIEAAWLLGEAAAVVGNADLTARIQALAVKIADVTLAEGVDSDGSLFNEGSPTGLTDTNKEWWQQAEAVVGLLDAYRISCDDRHLNAALRTWDFIEARLVDRKHGEWLRGVTRNGVPLPELKVSFWKCPYHNGRAGLEAPARLRQIAARKS